ncbi:ComF family protein [Bizionia paragorgiae]|uniref:ComF family protein n=1 Tax=Bizionia paragorgiae TaxID=283786 RepID=UPI003A8D24A2
MLSSLINLIFPKVCYTCTTILKDNEEHLCTLCRHKLPVTNFHKTDDPTVEKVFYGRAKVERATALLRFTKKGMVQKLLHQLKYKGQEDIGIFLGDWLGEELKYIAHYNTVDLIIPVPLHKRKKRQRGYNQVERFGRHLALALNTTYCDDVLLKTTNTSSQVTKNRFARWNDKTELFTLENRDKLHNKHVLLVDDIITTGATLEACIVELNKAKNVKISIATMAIA